MAGDRHDESPKDVATSCGDGHVDNLTDDQDNELSDPPIVATTTTTTNTTASSGILFKQLSMLFILFRNLPVTLLFQFFT